MGEKMSHYSVYKTRISNITTDFLKQAIKSLANHINAEIVNEVSDWYGNKHKVVIGLKNINLPRGIGFGVSKDGVLTVDGDSYGQWNEFNKIKALAQNYIKACKVAQNAMALNPASRVTTKVQEKAVVLEVCV